MIFKTIIGDVNKVALAMDSLKNISQFNTGSSIANGMALSESAIISYKTAIDGLSLSQAQAALSSTALTDAQKEQILVSAGLLQSTQAITLEEVKQMASSASLSAQKKEEILTTLQGAYSENEWNMEKLEAIAASGGEAGAIAQSILAKKTENAENIKCVASNKALTASLWEQLKARLALLAANPVAWIAGVATVSVGLIALQKKLTKSLNECTEELSNFNSEVENAQSEADSLQTEWEKCQKRLGELQKLADNGTISIIEQEEYERLLKTNNELERNIRIHKEKAQLSAIDAANSADEILSKTVESKYVTVNVQDSQGVEMTQTAWITPKEELNASIEEYKKLQTEIDRLKVSYDKGNISAEEYNTKLTDLTNQQTDARNRASEMSDILVESEQAYTNLTNTGAELTTTQTANYNSVKQANDAYNDFLDTINGVDSAFENLDTKEKAQSLKNKYAAKKVSLPNGQGSYTVEDKEISDWIDTLSDEDLTVLASINFSGEQTKDSMQEALDYAKNNVDGNTDRTDILSISSTVDRLNKQLKPAMESLASVWKDIFTEDGMALEDINILSVADTIKSKLDELAKIDGITVDYSSFEDFIRILEDASSTEEDVKNGFDKLAQSIVLAGVSGVEDFKTLKSSLGDLGVVNNEIVAFEALTRNTGALKTAGLDLINATDEQIRKFAEETVAAENVEQALAILMYRKELLSLEKMSTLQEITNLKNLAISAGYTGEVIDQLTQIEIIYQKIASGVLGTNNQEVAMAMEEARRLQKSIQESLANVNFMPEVDMTNVNKSGNSTAKKTAETIDWVETLLSRIQRTITNLGKTVSATYKNWSKRNNALAQEMKEINKEISAQSTAYDTYMAKANRISLPEEYKALVRNGNFSFGVIKDEALKKNIDLYRQWYEKALKCSDAIEDLRSNLADLAKTKFDNVAKQYDNQMLMIDHNIQMLQGFVEQSETAGHMASEVYYQAMAEKQQENINGLQAKYTSLLSAFDESVKNGSIEKYSEEWYNMLGDINDVEKALQSANTQLIEFNQTLQQLSWSVFDRIRDSVDNINTEANFLIDLISRSDLFTEAGQMTNEGLAVQGLRAVNYNTYMEQALAYAEEIKRINEEIATDPYDLELIDRKNELIKAQQEAIENSNSEKDAIQSLIKDGYDKMLSSLDKLIEKQKKFLNDQKSLYDYQNSISDQTSNIANLRKQLQAYSGDNSESAKSTIQKLNVSLTKAEKELRQSEYEKYISDQEELLDSLYSDTEQWINERLDDIDGLIIKAVDATNQNAETISNTINSAADAYSVKLSDKMTAIWDSQENAINGINTVVSIYGDIAHDDITSVGSNIANAINGGNTNVTSAISKIQVSMEQMISALNTIANTNKNSIANSQNNVINNQPNNTPSNSGNSSSGNNGGATNGGNTGGKTNGYKGYIGNELIITAPTKPMVELELKKAIERRAEKAAMDEYNRAIKAGYSPQDAGRSAENTKAGYSAQLYALKKIVAYASGTKNAKRGIGLVGEEENEIIFDKNGRAVLTLLPQLYDFKGGEQVLNGSDTKKLLNNVPTNFANSLARSGNNVTNNVDNIEIIVKANNAEEFVTSLKSALKNDPQCRKLVQCITVDELAGKGGLKRNNF